MIQILSDTTKEPLQLIGLTSAICYDSNISDKEKNHKRAIECIEADHGRVMEWVNVSMIVNGYSAKCIRELMRHIVGTSVLQESTRYVDILPEYDCIDAVCPKTISGNIEREAAWIDAICGITKGMKKLKALGVPKEDYSNLLPLAYKTKIVWKINLRALIHFMNLRLCKRAYWEIQDLCNEIKKELSKYSEEWKEICEKYFVPKCIKDGKCKENKSCGRMEKN